MTGHFIVDLLAGVVIVIGLVGAVIQVIPGLLLVGGAVTIWGAVTGGALGWGLAIVALLVTVLGTVLKYLLAGRYLQRQGVAARSLMAGAIVGIVGFFVIPVIGLPAGFVLGTYLAEWQRLRDQSAAWAATIAAMRATGLSILIELAAALMLSVAWIIALIVH